MLLHRLASRLRPAPCPLRTPGLLLLVLGPEQHLVVRRARGDHREAILQLVDHRRRRCTAPVDRQHLLDDAIDVVGLVRAQAHRAERLGELDEIRQRRGVALAVAAAMHQLLPLAHHAHVLVVEDEDLHRQPVLADRRHLLDVHQDRRLAGDVDDERVGARHLHAHRRRQAIAHRAEPARGHPVERLLELEELRRPHLVLADLGGDVGVAAAGQRIEPLDRVLRLDHLVGFAA